MPAPTATKAAIQRAIEAAKAAGLTPSAVTISKDGTVRVEAATEIAVDTSRASAQVLKPKKWSTR